MSNVTKFNRIKANAEKLDKTIAKPRKPHFDPEGSGPGCSPSPAVDDPAALLDEVEAYLRRYIAYPDAHAAVAHALWICHTHVMDAWESTPRLAFLSTEPGSGKSRALEVTEQLALNAIVSANLTVGYMIRRIAQQDDRPTLLIDEVDTVFGKGQDNESMRGLLNAGHRRGATVGRCWGSRNKLKPVETPAYCAVAMAGLGTLPDTILTRSVVIRMRKRSSRESIDAFRARDTEAASKRLRDLLAGWIAPLEPVLARARPSFPPEVRDRDADVWEPLLAIADAAGGSWPERARVAATHFVGTGRETSRSLGVLLLDHLRQIFGQEKSLWTETILAQLVVRDEAPWASLRGEPIDARTLARLLKGYGISSTDVRAEDAVKKGYLRSDLEDAWQRYLPPCPPMCATSATTATGVQDGQVAPADSGAGL